MQRHGEAFVFETQNSQHTEQGWLQDTKLICFLHISWVANDQSAVPSSWQRFQISSFQSLPEASLPVPVESGTAYCARLVETREKGTPVFDIAVYVLSMSFSLGPNCPFHPSARWELHAFFYITMFMQFLRKESNWEALRTVKTGGKAECQALFHSCSPVIIRLQLCTFLQASVCLPHPPISFDGFCTVHCSEICGR